MKYLYPIFFALVSLLTQEISAQLDTCVTEIDKFSGRKVFIYGNVMPQFPGGQDSLLAFIVKNLTWPEDDGANYMGTIIVAFIIESDGTLTNKNIIKGIYPKADTAVLKLIDKMPKWIPGKCKDKQVPFKTYVPLRFKLN